MRFSCRYDVAQLAAATRGRALRRLRDALVTPRCVDPVDELDAAPRGVCDLRRARGFERCLTP